MSSINRAATKQSDTLRTPCRTSLPGHRVVHGCGSFPGPIRSNGTVGCYFCVCRSVRVVLQHKQAGQQETPTEISPVDAAIDDRGTALHPLRPQGIGQFTVAPVARLHSTLNQQARLMPPVLHCLRFRLRCTGFGVKGNRATDSVHIRTNNFSRDSQRRLESILTHGHPSYLYVCLYYQEASSNA